MILKGIIILSLTNYRIYNEIASENFVADIESENSECESNLKDMCKADAQRTAAKFHRLFRRFDFYCF